MNEEVTAGANRSETTSLAFERTALAADRTLQAWIRTALSMISFGFTIGKLGQAAADWSVQGLVFDHEWGIKGLAYTLVATGTVALIVASIQHAHTVRDLKRRGHRTHLGLAFFVAITLALLGFFAFGSLVMKI